MIEWGFDLYKLKSLPDSSIMSFQNTVGPDG